MKLLALALVLGGLALDLWSKGWMQDRLAMDPGDPSQSEVIHLVPGFFRLEGTWNTGITFGLAAGYTQPILIFTVLACVGILVAILLLRSPSRVLHVALALVLAGAAGNLYDRWTWQKVRDFFVLYRGDWQWPAFNVADSLIVIGVGLIVGRELFGSRAQAPRTP
jgi:signal peptidase II